MGRRASIDMKETGIRYITWTKQAVKQLRADYDKAVEENKTEFESMGAEFNTGYAKYLLEFYESRIDQLK